MKKTPHPPPPFRISRPIVLVGLMGAGKSSLGRRLASRLAVPFVDADEEIEKAAGCSIPDIFELYGESGFRDGEQKVIRRLLNNGAQVLATGGGAFMDPRTRARIKMRATSVWLNADLDTLVARTARKNNRPLLQNSDPMQVLAELMEKRYPVYAEADLEIVTGAESIDATVERLIQSLEDYFKRGHTPPQEATQ